MTIDTNRGYRAFDRQIVTCRNWLQDRVVDACGYSAQVLTDRLMQHLVEISLQPYTSEVSILSKSTDDCFPAPGTQISCGRASMQIGSGRITITPKQWLANQLDFFNHWVFCAIAIISGKIQGKSTLPTILVFDVGDESLFVGSSDEQFVNFCRSGPIEPLREGKRFLVQSLSDNISSIRSEFVYCKRPLIRLLREAKMGLFVRVQLLANHVSLIFAYLFAAFRLPSLTLLGKDFAYSCISFELDKRGLINSIITTCSSFTCQPLWTRSLHRSEVHMVWYSQNWKPIAYASNNLDSDLPNLRWIRVNTHWVWTHAFAGYLRTLGHSGRIETVGPIMWYMPRINAPAADAIKIIIFDVPALDDDVLLRTCSELTNYFCSENLRAFVNDIISLKSELENIFYVPVSFRLKTKRAYDPAYDRAYFEYIEKLDSSGAISLEHYSTNIYSLISGSHLVIAYPFTSPAYVAEFLKVPSIYYDPTKSIVRHDFSDDRSLVGFASGHEGLLKASVSALGKVFPVKAEP